MFLWFCDVTIEFPAIGKKTVLAIFGNEIGVSGNWKKQKEFFFNFLLELTTRETEALIGNCEITRICKVSFQQAQGNHAGSFF